MKIHWKKVMAGYGASIKSYNFVPMAIMIVGGAVSGLLISRFMELSKWWAFFTISGMAVPFIAVLSGNPRRFFLVMLVLVLPVNADLNIDWLLRIERLKFLSLTLADIIIAMLYILWAADMLVNKKRKIHFFPSTTIPALIFLLLVALSYIANIDNPSTSFASLVPMGFGILIYFYLANNVKSEQDVRDIVRVFLFAALFQTIMSAAEIVTGVELSLAFQRATGAVWQQAVGESAYYSRISGTLGHPNALAIFLSGAIVLVVSLIFCESRRKWTFLYYLGIGAAFYAVVNTFSRTAWAVLAMFAPLTFFIYLWKSGSLRKAVLPIAGVAIVIAVISVSLSARISDRLVVDDSVMVRMPLNEVAMNMIKDNPFFGVGVMNYVSRSQPYDDTAIGVTSFFDATVHNILFLVAAEVGIPGLFVFLWMIVAVLKPGWQFLKSDIGFVQNVGLSFVTIVLMYFAFLMGNVGRIGPLLWFFFGMIIAIKQIANKAGTTSKVEQVADNR